MNLAEFLDENFWSTLLAALVLVSAVVAFGWFEYRRNTRLPHLGTVMVKNRLKGSG